MTIAAFVLIAFMFTMYVVLDGFDLGVAAIAPFVTRNDAERMSAMKSIGPFWNGNEVWLVAGGATLFALFPKAFASAFSGFYLPLIIVLWLLMGRGIAMELRNHYKGALWHQFWDAVFALSSVLLILLFGVALGNLIRGVPLDDAGYFQGRFTFLLNPYALAVGAFALAVTSLHGAIFLTLRVEGDFERGVRVALPWLWIASAGIFVATTIATFAMRPDLLTPLGLFLALLAAAVLIWVRREVACAHQQSAFLSSSVFIAMMLGAAAFTMFPYLLRAYPYTDAGISIYAAAASPSAMASALTVTIVALVATIIYTAWLWPKLAGKVRLEE